MQKGIKGIQEGGEDWKDNGWRWRNLGPLYQCRREQNYTRENKNGVICCWCLNHYFTCSALFPSTGETRIMCTIGGDSFYVFTKNIWIGDTGTSCQITYDDTGMLWVGTGKFGQCEDHEKEWHLHCSLTSWWEWNDLQSMAHHILCKSRCKPVLSELQTLAR